MGNPASLPARDAAARIAGGTLGIEALLRAYLARIAEREATVGAWEHLDPEQGLAEARRRDRAAPAGALCGIPFAIKDVIDTYDMPTGHGSPIYRGNRPAGDAACVALARAASAVALGKTVTAEFAALQPGRTTNPWNPAHTPGGSSSGSAAAVAAGMVPLALGTQSAGSIIRPAAYCGVVGYKPSFGMIPRSGVKPLADSFDTVGVFARDVADAAFFAAVLAERPELRIDEPIRAPRIALYRAPEWPRVDPATAALLEDVLLRLGRARAVVSERAALAEHEGLVAAQLTILDYEGSRALAFEWLTRREDISAVLRERLLGARGYSGADYDAAVAALARARAALPRLFGDADALLVPAAAGEAPMGLSNTGSPLFNCAWTALHLPCITLPAGLGPNGLPLGAQLVGKPGEDCRLLRIAAFLEGILGKAGAGAQFP